jgi:predicted nucleic acid-binding protein
VRVVIDVDVFVSAAIRTGPSHRPVQAWLKHEAFELIVCPRLLKEIDDVLARRRLRRCSMLTRRPASPRRFGSPRRSCPTRQDRPRRPVILTMTT